jgi:3'(2'), 5'-bisphosphate nucleotidase
MIDLRQAAEVALGVASEASDVVMRVYRTAFDVHYKAADDPVTRADREANALACERLTRAFPGIPGVAEESDPRTYAGFERAEATWFVDPVDGTREFVERNGQFAVMIGLAEGGRAKVGVIAAPAWGRTFVGVLGEGAWEIAADGARTPIHVSSRAGLQDASIVVSRSRTPRLAALVGATGARQPTLHGSSGLKGALVAIGEHDGYLQPGRAGMRWDACATDALVCAAGGAFSQTDGTPIDYGRADLVNDRGLLADNGHIHDPLLAALRAHPADS